ncbi:hypothetical protein C922_05637 [Plasmodium inui San Antonio 1]|uniref:Uncharacterized protein n=1 Tax=Plasmodium inui San Antonio 1 TaxID=1237626 RepID=W6ZXJ6_9APIC|nr:hypothetical protein C922_05637 [Plasmodium inui San Antonio 1]EUD63985.1 hypothetical protein C922_05637 [Plasmodium inui San Antonio 1]
MSLEESINTAKADPEIRKKESECPGSFHNLVGGVSDTREKTASENEQYSNNFPKESSRSMDTVPSCDQCRNAMNSNLIPRVCINEIRESRDVSQRSSKQTNQGQSSEEHIS